MYKKALLILGILYVAASVYLLKLRIDFSGADSARGLGFSFVCGVASYITGVYLLSSQRRKLNKLLGVALLFISLALLVLQVWYGSYYPNSAL